MSSVEMKPKEGSSQGLLREAVIAAALIVAVLSSAAVALPVRADASPPGAENAGGSQENAMMKEES